MNASVSFTWSPGSPLGVQPYAANPMVFVMPNAAPVSTVTLGEAIAETITSKTRLGCRQKYVTSLRQYLQRFARGREDKAIASLTAADVSAWFTERSEAPSSEAANRGRLDALFTLCIRRNWISRNPTDGLDPIRWHRQPAKVLTVDQCQMALSWCKGSNLRFLASLVLMLMAGIRPEEVEKITWSSIDLDEGTIIIEAAASKVRRRRIVQLQPIAVEWLRYALLMSSVLPMAPTTKRRCLRQLRDVLGLEVWPQDVLRHTAASFLLAQVQDVGKVSLWLGNSPGILLNHYTGLVSRTDAERFWSMTPFGEVARHGARRKLDYKRGREMESPAAGPQIQNGPTMKTDARS